LKNFKALKMLMLTIFLISSSLHI